MECRYLSLVFFPVGKLRLDLFDGAIAPVGKPRRELFGTVFAEIAVFQLAVAKLADLFPANVAIFLIEQSHVSINLLPHYCYAHGSCYAGIRIPLRMLEYSHKNHWPVEAFCRSFIGRGESAPAVLRNTRI